MYLKMKNFSIYRAIFEYIVPVNSAPTLPYIYVKVRWSPFLSSLSISFLRNHCSSGCSMTPFSMILLNIAFYFILLSASAGLSSFFVQELYCMSFLTYGSLIISISTISLFCRVVLFFLAALKSYFESMDIFKSKFTATIFSMSFLNDIPYSIPLEKTITLPPKIDLTTLLSTLMRTIMYNFALVILIAQ